MRQLTFLMLFLLLSHFSSGQDLVITGVFDGPLSGGTKVIELYALTDIPDLSAYGIGSANNGNDSSGPGFTFSGTATAGEFIYATNNSDNFATFFGFSTPYITGIMSVNGDDVLELFLLEDEGMGDVTETLIDSFGILGVDGTGQDWEYLDGWAYRVNSSAPDGPDFTIENWIFSNINDNDDDTSQDTATNPWPIGTYGNSTPECTLTLGTPVATCDTTTDGIDGITTAISFTGGGLEEYTLFLLGGGVIGGDDPSILASGTIEITASSEDSQITLEVSSASCELFSVDFTTPVCEPATEVSNIGVLRASAEGEAYTILSEAVITFQQDFRNQKFIQDGAAAILIDDNEGIITTAYNTGDGLVGVTGTLSSLEGMLQFTPTQDTGQAFSTDNPIEPQQVTVTELTANPNEYEAQYVQLVEASIDTSTNTDWEAGTDYNINTPEGNYIVRTLFSDVNYIGQTVPTTIQNISGIITERNNGDYAITPRSLSDFEEFLSVDNNTLNTLSIYPNPSSTSITITTATQGEKAVAIYKITGKKVIDIVTSNPIDVSTLSTGIYLVKVTDAHRSRTSRLIIK